MTLRDDLVSAKGLLEGLLPWEDCPMDVETALGHIADALGDFDGELDEAVVVADGSVLDANGIEIDPTETTRRCPHCERPMRGKPVPGGWRCGNCGKVITVGEEDDD